MLPEINIEAVSSPPPISIMPPARAAEIIAVSVRNFI
jgi:hypothetical protein